jgi:hypothetical protein
LKKLLETDEDLNKTEKELWDEKNENKKRKARIRNRPSVKELG